MTHKFVLFEATAAAEPESDADAYYGRYYGGYRGYGLGYGYGYGYGRGYWGRKRRSAESDADAESYYGYGGYGLGKIYDFFEYIMSDLE